MQDTQGDESTFQIAGFWRRLVAVALDGLLLGLVGLALSAAMFDQLVRMGIYGRLLGFVIALAYFGTFNSVLGGGQTLGKRLLDIRVVGRDGALLSLPRAMARAALLEVPFFLNGAGFGAEVLFSAWNYLLSLLIFGGLLSIVYLYVFNRKTRQSLHDLAVGSYVVRRTSSGPAPSARVWTGHLVVVVLLLIAAACVPILVQRLSKMPFFAEIMPAYEAVSKLPHVQAAGVNVVTSTRSGRKTEYVSIRLQLDVPRVGDRTLAETAARTVLASYPKSASKAAIHVQLVYGYDIGIASGWKFQSYSFDPRQLATQRTGD